MVRSGPKVGFDVGGVLGTKVGQLCPDQGMELNRDELGFKEKEKRSASGK